MRILLTTPDIRTIEELNAASDETVLAMIQASVQVGHGVIGFTGSSPLTIQARREARKGRAAKKRPRVRERGAWSSSGEDGGESDDVMSTDGSTVSGSMATSSGSATNGGTKKARHKQKWSKKGGD